MNVLYTTEAKSVGGRDGRVTTSRGNLDLPVKPPKEIGGPDGDATNPEELFACGYSACFLSALSITALMQKISAKKFTVTARVDLVGHEDGSFGIQAELDCELPEVEQEKAEELVRLAHDRCPYSKATRGNIEVGLLVNGKRIEHVAV
jgi:osmotically inducible protein OsmC